LEEYKRTTEAQRTQRKELEDDAFDTVFEERDIKVDEKT
jgi:hypothetical protein